MVDTKNIREHMEVLGSDGGHVGAVDAVEGRSIKLTRRDSPAARGEHRYIPLDWVESVGQSIKLNKLTADAQQEWQAHPVKEGEYPPDEK